MANPKLAMIPTGYKAGKVYSVLPESGVGDFTFDRDSLATRVNEDGLIETMAIDVPRLDYTDGGCPSLLLEPERTNLITSSQGSIPVLVNVTQVTNNSISPDGSNNSTLITSDTTSGPHYFGFNNTSVTSGTSYTGSVFVKKGTGRYFQLLYGSGGFNTTKFITFDLESGIIVYTGVNTSGNIEAIGKNGWYRLSISTTADSTAAETMYCGIVTSGTSIRLKPHTSILTYSIYGAQFEESEYPTSYIPTNGTTVTRVGETCTGAGDTLTFNDSEGVLMAEIKGLSSSDTSNRRLGITKNGTYEGLRIQMTNSGTIEAVLYDGSSNQYSESISKDTSIYHKICFKYKVNDFALWVDGFEYLPSASGNTFANDTLDDLSFDYVGGNPFYGNTKQIQYFDSALTDAELETLTSWQSFSEMANGQNYTII